MSDLLSLNKRTAPPGIEGQVMGQQPKQPLAKPQGQQPGNVMAGAEVNPDAEKASAVGKVLSAIGKALAQPGAPDMLAGLGVAFGTSPTGIKSAGARAGEQFLAARATTRQIEAQKVAEVMAGREVTATEETAAAATSRAATLAETGPIEAKATLIRAEAFERQVSLTKQTDAEKEAKRLAAKREGREYAGLKSDFRNLKLEREAHLGNVEFFSRIGEGGVPESIAVSWSDAKEEEYHYLLALSEAGYDTDLSLYPPETEEQQEIFIQSVMDQGIDEAAAFDRLIELGAAE